MMWLCVGFLIFFVAAGTASDNACNSALGLQDGRIKDSQLSASSDKYMYISRLDDYYNTYARYGRLKNNLAWCGRGPWGKSRPVSYFQVDFGEMVNVTGLSTQGFNNWIMNYYVKTYTLGFSLNGNDWFDYSAPNKIWSGNRDSNSINRVICSKPIRTRYLRIYPREYKTYRCLRVEVYGCRLSEVDKSNTSSTASPSHQTPALLPSAQMTSPMTSRIHTPAIHASQQYNTAEISHSRDLYILTTTPSHVQPSSTVEKPDIENNARSTSMGISPSSPSTQALFSEVIRAERVSSSSVLQYKVVFLLGICVGCGLLVVVTMLVFVWLKSRTGQGKEIAHRNLKLECRMTEKPVERFTKRDFV